MGDNHNVIQIRAHDASKSFDNMGNDIERTVYEYSSKGYRIISAIPLITKSLGFDGKPEESYVHNTVLVFEKMKQL